MLYAARGDFEPRRHLPGTASLLPPPRFEGFESWAQGSVLLRDLEPVAVIAPLSPPLADSADYLDFLLACVRRSADDPAFRLYLHPSGATPEELTAAAAENAALGEVIDTVHVSMAAEQAAFGEIDEAVGHFLSSVQDIRDAQRYRRILLRLWTPLGLAEVPMLAGAALAAAATAGSAAFQNATGAPVPLGEPVRTLVSVGVGAALSLLGLGVVFARGRRFAAAVLAGIVIVCAVRTSMPPNPLFLGIVAALALDYLRRSWAALLPVSLSFSQTQAPRSFVERRPVCWLTRMLGGPLRPQPRAFISYARRTWADDPAKGLRARLTAGGLNCFLDIQDIELGSCWRHALEFGIRNCTVFLFFDQAEPGRPPRIWHRAELYTAALMRRRTGSPWIVVLTPAEQAVQPISFYRQRLSDLADLTFQMIPVSPEQVDELADNLVLRSGFGAPTHLHMAVLSALTIAPQALGMYGFTVGSLAIIPVLVLRLLRAILLPTWLWAALALLGWLSAGFGLRAVLHERFEAVAPVARGIWRLHLAQLTLLLAALAIGSPWRDVSVSPWGPLLCLVGFVSFDLFWRGGRPNFRYGSRSVTDRL